MISRDEILQDQACPPALEGNLQVLLSSLNELRALYGKPMIVTSGYRSPDHNADVGGHPQSAHMLCMAVDFHDPDNSLKDFILANPNVLEQCRLYCEDWKFQPAGDTHVHLQTRPTASGNRLFIP